MYLLIFGVIDFVGIQNKVLGTILYAFIFCVFFAAFKYSFIFIKLVTVVLIKTLRTLLTVANSQLLRVLFLLVLLTWFSGVVFLFFLMMYVIYFCWWVDLFYSLYCFVKHIKSKKKAFEHGIIQL